MATSKMQPTLPASFAKSGFTPYVPKPIRGGKRRLLVGSEGLSGTGKTEFSLSMPGPIVLLSFDLGLEGVIDKDDPPPARCDRLAVKEYAIKAVASGKDAHLETWKVFFADYKEACANEDVRSLVIDTGSECWDLMRLVNFGKLTQVPPIKYTQVNQDFKDLIRMSHDAGVNLVMTHRLKKHYSKKPGADANDMGEWTGDYDRQGFSDQDYLVQVNIRHFTEAGQFCLEVTKSRQAPNLNGLVLKGDECNFSTLAMNVYPESNEVDWR